VRIYPSDLELVLLYTGCQNLHFAGLVFLLHHSDVNTVNIVPAFLIILVSWPVSLFDRRRNRLQFMVGHKAHINQNSYRLGFTPHLCLPSFYPLSNIFFVIVVHIYFVSSATLLYKPLVTNNLKKFFSLLPTGKECLGPDKFCIFLTP
jgi:hypothetical protein